MDSIRDNTLFVTAIIHWLVKFTAQGIIVTDDKLKIRFYNDWFEKQSGKNAKDLIECDLLEAFPELAARGFDRYYRNALKGQGRVLSHKFHRYLLRMPPPLAAAAPAELAVMQQSARISPLFDGETVVGTITSIEDVTERAAREIQLNLRIEERERLLASERSARRLAEENSRLKDTNESLRLVSMELMDSEKERGKLLHQVISAQEEERKRISRNIHDHLGQHLTALRLILASMREQNEKDSNPSGQLDKARAIAERIDSEVDFLVWEIRPTIIDDLGLVKALENFVNEWSRYLKIPIEFHCIGLKEKRMSPDIEINLYRIAQEALNNISKHARASHVSILLEGHDRNAVLIIEDDGAGFEPGKNERANGKDGAMGLLGMKERALLVGGTVEIESAIGSGTTIYVRVPMRLNDKTEK